MPYTKFKFVLGWIIEWPCIQNETGAPGNKSVLNTTEGQR